MSNTGRGIAIAGNILADAIKMIERFPKPSMLVTILSTGRAVGGAVANPIIDLAVIGHELLRHLLYGGLVSHVAAVVGHSASGLFLDLLTGLFQLFLIGNGDAHGKNFSVLYHGNHPRLAPQYDLICTAVYPPIAKKMAMKLDGKFDFRWVTAGKIVRTFERAGIGEKSVCDSIARQVSAVRRTLPGLLDEVESRWPSPVYHDICKGIHGRIRQLEQA